MNPDLFLKSSLESECQKKQKFKFYLDITLLIVKNSCLEQNAQKLGGGQQKNKQQYLIIYNSCSLRGRYI